ncbi:uncharacterized protein [Diadema antillarum]|uniref:uncharacterized protein n=1 Tax=Diadema antillarum TaxID=105358 RepID=UPI003A87F94D
MVAGYNPEDDVAIMFQIRRKADGLVIVGDFNIHWDNQSNADTKKFADIIKSHDLLQHVCESTHISGHILDYVLSRRDEDAIRSVEVSSFLSDHAAVHCDLHMSKPAVGRKEIVYRKLKTINHEALAEDLESSDLIRKPETDIDKLADQYDRTLSTILDKHAPIKRCVVATRPPNPWYSEEITEAKKLRRRLERKWRKTRLEVDRQCFRDQGLIVLDMIKKAKASFYEKQISDCVSQRDVYKVIDKMLHYRNKSVLPTHRSDQELAEKFIRYFSTKIQDIRATLDAEVLTGGNLTTAHSTEKDHTLNSFDLASEEEVRKIISGSPPSSSSQDPVPTWILKRHLHLLLPSITLMVNRSLETGIFPSSFKQAVVRPLLKKPSLDPDTLNSYRPVCNLKFISKVLERVVAQRLQEYLELNDLSEPLQSAYKKHHSTESALIKVHNDIHQALDKKQAVFLVLLDLSAAFDTIDKDILITRFRSIGVKGSALAWISSYLCNRSQAVRINECMSSFAELLYGVPQGSVLGPSFFSIYASPLAEIARTHGIHIHLYADDTQLYSSFDPSDPLSEASTRHRLEACIGDMRA